jgi:hypothetical protein
MSGQMPDAVCGDTFRNPSGAATSASFDHRKNYRMAGRCGEDVIADYHHNIQKLQIVN